MDVRKEGCDLEWALEVRLGCAVGSLQCFRLQLRMQSLKHLHGKKQKPFRSLIAVVFGLLSSSACSVSLLSLRLVPTRCAAICLLLCGWCHV
eukprot:364640-Chlamydomonas_euryale.AAC.11